MLSKLEVHETKYSTIIKGKVELEKPFFFFIEWNLSN